MKFLSEIILKLSNFISYANNHRDTCYALLQWLLLLVLKAVLNNTVNALLVYLYENKYKIIKNK